MAAGSAPPRHCEACATPGAPNGGRSVAPVTQTGSPAARPGRFYLPLMRPALSCRYLDWNFTEIDERRNVRLRYTDEAMNSPLQIVNRRQYTPAVTGEKPASFCIASCSC